MERHIIKFKAKSLDDGKWKKGCYCYNLSGGASIFPIEREVSVGDVCMVDPATVCQYTGLTDMKGREIWEHDYITDFPHCGEVIFVDGGFAMHSDVGDLPLETFVDRVKDGALGTYGKCLVTNQGSVFDRKEGEE